MNIVYPDILLVPLVAFDIEGYRVGMGMGYYDTTLLEIKKSKTCKIWGIAYEFQEEESCFPEFHDLKLDAVLCPSGLREFACTMQVLIQIQLYMLLPMKLWLQLTKN